MLKYSFKIYNNNQKKEVIILEINKNIFKRTIEYFKNNASLRDSLKEGRRRSGVGKLPIHRNQHSPK